MISICMINTSDLRFHNLHPISGGQASFKRIHKIGSALVWIDNCQHPVITAYIKYICWTELKLIAKNKRKKKPSWPDLPRVEWQHEHLSRFCSYKPISNVFGPNSSSSRPFCTNQWRINKCNHVHHFISNHLLIEVPKRQPFTPNKLLSTIKFSNHICNEQFECFIPLVHNNTSSRNFPHACKSSNIWSHYKGLARESKDFRFYVEADGTSISEFVLTPLA